MLKLLNGDIAELGSNILLKELKLEDGNHNKITFEINSFLEKAIQYPDPVIAFAVDDNISDNKTLISQTLVDISDFLFEYNSKRDIFFIGSIKDIDEYSGVFHFKLYRRSFLIRGRVQGVFYRKSTEEKAITLNLTGFVRNCDDGSVYVEAQGNLSKILSLFEWCLDGPDMARVENIKVNNLEVIKSESDFKVKR